MTEERVTKLIIQYLIDSAWEIVAYDFPQSGTGKMLHPDDSISEKNKGGIIPDIVAVKDGICLFFENKDRIVFDDFNKINALRSENAYTKAIAAMLTEYSIQQIFFGIGIPTIKWIPHRNVPLDLVDFVMAVTADGDVEWKYNPNELNI